MIATVPLRIQALIGRRWYRLKSFSIIYLQSKLVTVSRSGGDGWMTCAHTATSRLVFWMVGNCWFSNSRLRPANQQSEDLLRCQFVARYLWIYQWCSSSSCLLISLACFVQLSARHVCIDQRPFSWSMMIVDVISGDQSARRFTYHHSFPL